MKDLITFLQRIMLCLYMCLCACVLGHVKKIDWKAIYKSPSGEQEWENGVGGGTFHFVFIAQDFFHNAKKIYFCL